MVEALVQEGCGASTCNTCLRITCAACGRSKKPTQYRRKHVWNYLKQRTNTRCRACRRRGYRRGCRCTKCGVYQRSSAFRWTTRRGREVQTTVARTRGTEQTKGLYMQASVRRAERCVREASDTDKLLGTSSDDAALFVLVVTQTNSLLVTRRSFQTDRFLNGTDTASHA